MEKGSKFKGKTVLVTGHTGFKGSWLVAWLKIMGAEVTGIGLDPYTVPSNFEAASIAHHIKDFRQDIRDQEKLADIIVATKPDFVFHLAAQALVRN